MARTTSTNRLVSQDYGKSLVFDGATNGVTLTGFKVSTTAFTIALWVKVRKFTANDRILDQQDGGPANAVTLLESASGITFVLRNSTTNVSNIASGSMLVDKWYHLIATYIENDSNFYVNNVLVGSDTSCTMTDSTAVMLLGKRVGGSNFFNGYMKDFLIYNRVISSTERSGLYYKRTIPTSPQVYLELNDNLTDSSGNGTNGDAVGTLSYSTTSPLGITIRSSSGTRNGLTQNYQINAGTLLEGFQTIGDWTRTSAAGSIAEDTTNFTYGDKSLRVTFASGTSVFYDKTINQVVNGGVSSVVLKVFIPSLTNLGSVALYIASVSNFSKFFSATIQATSLHEGFNYIAISPSEWSNTGSESWSNTMVRLRIRINATTGTPAVSFCELYTGRYSRPKILVTFDDGWDSSYTKGFAYMETKGIKGTSYIIRDKVDTAGYATTAQLAEMNTAGWDLGTHGNTNLTTLGTQALQETEISYNEAYLTNNGFTRANKHYAYPNGGYNDNAREALASLGYKTARTIIDRTQHNYLDEKYLLKRYGILSTTSVANAKSYIDSAIARGEAILLNYHIIVDADADTSTKVLTANFNEVMDYIALKKFQQACDVVTISEWYNGLTNPRLAV